MSVELAPNLPDPLDHKGLVRTIARDYRGRGLEIEDLVQEGFLGLVRACADCAPGREDSLGSYAGAAIRNAIRDATIDQAFPVRVPVHLHRLRWRLRRGAVAGVTRTQEDMLAAAAPHWRPGGYQEPGPDDPDPPLADLAIAPEEERTDPWEVARLRTAIAELPPRQRNVIRMRYGLGGGEPRTLREVGAAIGRTREWARQLERKALARLRKALKSTDQ